MKKSESERESEIKLKIKQLEERIIRMELAFDALDRRLEGNARHPEDDGWFD